MAKADYSYETSGDVAESRYAALPTYGHYCRDFHVGSGDTLDLCPYRLVIDGDGAMCRCCNSCHRQCMWDAIDQLPLQAERASELLNQWEEEGAPDMAAEEILKTIDRWW